jgi:hypothetical protein
MLTAVSETRQRLCGRGLTVLLAGYFLLSSLPLRRFVKQALRKSRADRHHAPVPDILHEGKLTQALNDRVIVHDYYGLMVPDRGGRAPKKCLGGRSAADLPQDRPKDRIEMHSRIYASIGVDGIFGRRSASAGAPSAGMPVR